MWQLGTVCVVDLVMKPFFQYPKENRWRFPLTDYCFHAGFGDWRGSSSPPEDDSRKFRNFSREFLLESAREQKKEMIVFTLVVLTAAWPVIYMLVAMALLLKSQPIGQ